ncbi:hypothetical protein J4Q44_G00234200 [Coregonus suidteri]|uniref:Uncharacterized protein n=1 Tax=Coregonus suidteri TaxID=861788 RepID=A0AAN8LB53_9TELE
MVKRANGGPSCPHRRTATTIPFCLPLISTYTHNVSCQTVDSSLVPCDACAQVQSSLRETGDALVELCRSEGLPTSLQRLLVAVDDILEQGRLTVGDVSQCTQLLLDKENFKYQNACRQQESLQAKQMSLLERVDALDQEFPEALCSELQQEKQRLESHVGKLKDSVDQLKGEVQELAQSERLLVVFPELNPLPQGPPKSTGDVL